MTRCYSPKKVDVQSAVALLTDGLADSRWTMTTETGKFADCFAWYVTPG